MRFDHNVSDMTGPMNGPLALQPSPIQQRKAAKVAVIRGELVDLTGAHQTAVILNQLLYWTKRVKDFDLLLEEERHYHSECNVPPRHGWIYKTAQELNEETMLSVDRTTMRRYLSFLVENGWIDERINPSNKWDKTTQYRVNLRKLNQDLLNIGYTLSDLDFHEDFSNGDNALSSGENTASNVQNALPKEQNFTYPTKPQENSNVQNALSNGYNSLSNGYDSPSKEEIDPSNVTNCSLYIQRLQSENINREQQQRARARTREGEEACLKEACVQEACLGENFFEFGNSKNFPLEKASFKNSDSGNLRRINSILTDSAPEGAISDACISDVSISDTSVAAEMLNLWNRHVEQHLPNEPNKSREAAHFTKELRDTLESLFAFHFKNDMRLWEQFCLRVKASSFLMGHGARKWTVELAWIMKEGNVSKILSGKYDDAHRSEHQDSFEVKLEKVQAPTLNAEKAAILASIKDPVWKKWCTQLATGVRLNDFKMLHEPLSTLQLSQIANAWFLEIEDDRLVWVGSFDQVVLNKIDDLRLKINWVFAKEYPKASTFRTRLVGHVHTQGSSQTSYSETRHHE